MLRFSRFLWLWFIALLAPAWFLQRHLESSGQSDYLGLWYTVLCTVMWAILALGAIALALLFRIWLSNRVG
jgi:hypothetical protein